VNLSHNCYSQEFEEVRVSVVTASEPMHIMITFKLTTNGLLKID